MAAAITTVSTTLEGQAFEILTALQTGELAVDPATRPNNASLVPDFETLQLGMTLTLPFTYADDGSGGITISVSEYLA